MPETQWDAESQAKIAAEFLDRVLKIVPDGARLVDSSLKEFGATLTQHCDLAAVIVVLGDNWFTKLFAEAWSVMPNRLASLAMCPPAASFQWYRPGDDFIGSVRAATFTPWEHLIALAKRGLKIELQTIPIEWESANAIAKANEIQERRLPELLSSPPNHELEWLFNELHLARLSDLCGDVVSPADATAVLAGLWLLHGDADASHRCSQSIEDEGRHRCGNFWHAIMHRQEPDYGNSKYWFRRVGQHPIFPELARRTKQLLATENSEAARRFSTQLGNPPTWNPFAFVDGCEQVVETGNEQEKALFRRIQFTEMALLLQATFKDATCR